MDWSAIISSLIVSISTFLGVVYVKNRRFEEEKKALEERLESQFEAKMKMMVEDLSKLKFEFLVDLKKANIIDSAIQTMFSKTRGDRFLIFVGRNGKSRFRIANCILDRHKENEHTLLSLDAGNTYREYQPDDHYYQLIREARLKDFVLVETDKMEPSDLKEFYAAEKVKESYIFHLTTTRIDEDNDMIVYCSIATHENDGFMRSSYAHIKPAIGIIKEVFHDAFKLKE